MAWAVFMRAVNVGGHQVFRPAELAKKLADWDVANIGAAGTFAVRKRVSQNSLRAGIRRHMPFDVGFTMCRGEELEKLVAADPFGRVRSVEGLRLSVCILENPPREVPALPHSHPAGAEWQVRIVGLQGPFALVAWRHTGKRMIYPNEVVEKTLGVRATTRTWETILKVHRALQKA